MNSDWLVGVGNPSNVIDLRCDMSPPDKFVQMPIRNRVPMNVNKPPVKKMVNKSNQPPMKKSGQPPMKKSGQPPMKKSGQPPMKKSTKETGKPMMKKRM